MDLHIFDLPTEIVLNIFSYVPSTQVLLNVCRVCKHFNEMLRSEWYWRTRYVQSIATQPIVSGLDLQQWQLGCMQAEFAAMARRGARNLTMSQLRGGWSHGVQGSFPIVSRGQTLDGKVRVWSTAHIGLVLTPTTVGVGDKYVRTTAFTTCRVYYKALSKQSQDSSGTVYVTPYNKRDRL